ncbi:CRIB domain-containing protein RIC4 [Tripterygium wilfordii]|uniref:CRIB domain-containing protein RIC4 n=1 Tax=Tripterygium wilfordii TaxID=458696 RepID=A0A7J7BWU5_TRIWF|nr:CRIB domain-containing protein RIC4-like [Tripterygium wilfordii]KAF5726343.1 CRIB domain-containing protein RIC4 [Tripterygium wilfordii]
MIRDRMERLVLLPFSIGCVSESSVALGTTTDDQNNRPRTKTHTINSLSRTKEDEEERSSSDQSMKNSTRFLQSLPKPHISTGFHRLFKTFSHLFVYKEGMEDDDLEMAMEIGGPTDVKHVTHIGWDDLIGPELLSPPSPPPPPPPPLKQFELSMAAQAHHHASDLDKGLSKLSSRDESGY